MSFQTLVVFHYHLLAGGVRSSLRNGLLALGRTGSARKWLIRLLVGRAAGIESFAAELKSVGFAVEPVVDRRLDYAEQVWPDVASFRRQSLQLARWLLSQAVGDTVFWLHNPTLGKNPLVTAAWVEAAKLAEAEQAAYRFLYHIHDFAECGRIENLRRLRGLGATGGISECYPATGNVGYATLNQADGERLVLAGVPRQRVFRLPNVVTHIAAAEPQQSSTGRIGRGIAAFARKEGYHFVEKRPWWVLPIRLIRRKNVLEALLVAALAKEPPQLLVTLDATSAQERPYAEAVKALVKRERHPLVIGFGAELVGTAFDLPALLAAAATVVTTSLLEGFGFAFLDAAMNGGSLMGRDVPDVTSDFKAAGFPDKGLYRQFLVPLSKADGARLQSLAAQLTGNLKALGMSSSQVLDAFEQQLMECYGRDRVDFGMLDLATQTKVLSQLRHPARVREWQDLNPHLPRCVVFPADIASRLLTHFGPAAYAEKFLGCLRRLGELEGRAWGEGVDLGSRVLEQFLSPLHQRPLLGGWS